MTTSRPESTYGSPIEFRQWAFIMSGIDERIKTKLDKFKGEHSINPTTEDLQIHRRNIRRFFPFKHSQIKEKLEYIEYLNA